MPATILVHEAAHYLGYIAFGLPNPTLAYAFSGFEGMQSFWQALNSGDTEAARAIAPIVPVGITALLGVLATLAMGMLGIWALSARDSLVGGALAFTALFRSGAIALLYVAGNPENSDEAHIAITLGWPDVLLVIAGVLALTLTGWLLYKRFDWKVLMGVALGSGASLAAWMTKIGPMMLP
ncbi:hypothetical protein [Erythrobacter rubeus]|uniref:Uncharacterized protein n=1 Tax=Erythrobacter rubeus TaxID=2760803 RepID=A0ABR8KKQ8_9SPHN|nr:hypothetical protein [Erythrobacter rubeus]MBD2840872.1 hypothetical protein [Erythrobacter rubeus]